MLSHHEQRCLAQIEHDLEHDQTLTSLAQQLAGHKPFRRRRAVGLMWWVALALELGALSWVAVGVVLNSQVMVIAGLLIVVVLGIPLIGTATARLLDRRRRW